MQQELKADLTYPGTVAAVHQVNLVARTSGIITAFAVQPGQAVKEGDLIAKLDDTTQQAQLPQAQAALAAAQANQLKVA